MWKTILTTAIILWSSISIYSQELRSVYYNHRVKNAYANKQDQESHKSAKEEKEYYNSWFFFDDFSLYREATDPTIFGEWTDNKAYINSTYAAQMISLGVATLDAVDEKGDLYAVSDILTSSDTLTSKKIDLSSATGDSLYLSFLYQRGGYGEAPEEQDSLIVQFTIDDSLWNTVYSISGGYDTVFNQVDFKIPAEYYAPGFRFRYINYTSVSEDDVIGGEGAVGNADQWHLDYIRVMYAESEENLKIEDFTIIKPLLPSLKFYSSIPYKHLDNAKVLYRGKNELVFRNLMPDEFFAYSRHYKISTVDGVPEGYGPYQNQVTNEDTIHTRVDFLPFPIEKKQGKRKAHAITMAYVESADHYQGNDTVVRNEYFLDYYAYDDGSSELGFGISGEPSPVDIACKYGILRKEENPDTLEAVYIYFNQDRDSANLGFEFNIVVWDEDNGKPGDVIYISEETYTPRYSSGLNEFIRYELEKELLVSDTIFVGVRQETTEFLNIGYDINTDSRSNIFTRTTADWQKLNKSTTKGSLMIRPSFGVALYPTNIVQTSQSTTRDLLLYPNPVSEELNISGVPAKTIMGSHAFIYNSLGQVVYQDVISQPTINVNDFKNGFYIIQLKTHNGQKIAGKFIVKH